VRLDAAQLPLRQLNAELRAALAAGQDAVVENPRSQHNLGVALPGPGKVTFEGSVGYYCGGLNDGSAIEIMRNAGWGIGEAMASGAIRVHGNVEQSVGASLMGGTIVVEGHAGPRAGVAQKGGAIIVGGNIGFLSGFMAQAGKMIVLGNAADGVGDSLYEGRIYVAGAVEGLGIDTKIEKPEPAEIDDIEAQIAAAGFPLTQRDWKKVVAAGKLWYFDKREAQAWLKV